MNDIAYLATRSFVRSILADPFKHPWTLQGFGMLRLHLPDNLRLHVWDPMFRVPGVSDIHDHMQWGLESLILSGHMTNMRFAVKQSMRLTYELERPSHYMMTIRAGTGGGPVAAPEPVVLLPHNREIYVPGMSYYQRPEEVHQSWPSRGAVTIMQKTPVDGEDRARVFWSHSQGPNGWVSAEPRTAAPNEVLAITRNALTIFDRE